jgi:hypothetical protein
MGVVGCVGVHWLWSPPRVRCDTAHGGRPCGCVSHNFPNERHGSKHQHISFTCCGTDCGDRRHHDHHHFHHRKRAGCGGVTRCLNHTHCAKCLEAINATAGFAHSLASFDNFESAAFREYTVAFFQTLQSTVSCSTSATPPSILHPALEELDGVNSCIVEYRMITGNCILSRVSATAWRLEAHVCELAQNTLALNRCLAHSGHWLQPPGAWRHTFVSSHRMRWPLMGARLMQAQILARRHSAARTSVHSRRACTSAPLCVLHTPSLAWQPPIPHHPQWCSISAILLWTNRTLACSNRI